LFLAFTFIWSSSRNISAIFAKVCHDFGAEPKECSGEDDHVHLFYRPKVTLSKLVNSLKGVSSRLLRDQRPEICAIQRRRSLVAVLFRRFMRRRPIAVITEYIRNQRKATLPALKGGISGARKEG
jgi:putative transposase